MHDGMRYRPLPVGARIDSGMWVETELRTHLGGEWVTIHAMCWVTNNSSNGLGPGR